MEIYEEKNSCVNIAKYFFIKKSKLLIVIVILGLGLLTIGWYCWRSQQLDSIHKASQFYENTVRSISIDQPQTLSIVEKFIIDNKNTYGVLAALKVVQFYVDKNELDRAVTQLQRVISATSDNNLKSLINLRIARIQMQQKKADDMLKTLNAIKGESFIAIVADLRSEALLMKGDNHSACSVLEKGLKSNISPTLRKRMKIKINNLFV